MYPAGRHVHAAGRLAGRGRTCSCNRRRTADDCDCFAVLWLAARLSSPDHRFRQQFLCLVVAHPVDDPQPRRAARFRRVQRLPAVSAGLCVCRRGRQHLSGVAGIAHHGGFRTRYLPGNADDGRDRADACASVAAAWRVARRWLYPSARHYHARPRRAAFWRAYGARPAGRTSCMTASDGGLCRHCLLPVGPRALQQIVNGEGCAFCCYGCSIAFQVKNGKTEEWEAAWLLIRLGIGGFLSMNIMLFSLLIYGGVFTGADARLLPFIDILLLVLATPAVVILGGPFLRETLVEGARGRLTASVLIVLGVGAAYIYSTLAVIEGNAQVYFDTAAMVLILFTLGRYLEAAGRARAARDLEPLLAAERENVRIVENDGTESLRPVRQVETGTVVRVRPGERIAVDGVIVEGA